MNRALITSRCLSTGRKLSRNQELFNKSTIVKTLNYTIWDLLTWVKWAECNRLGVRCIYTDTIRCTDRYKPDNHSCTTNNIHEQPVY